MNDSTPTLIQKDSILNAIAELRTEMNNRFNNVETRLKLVEDKLIAVEQRIIGIESDVFSVNVRLNRLEGMAHEAIGLAKNVQADTMVINAEVQSWTRDVKDLQKKIA